MSKSLLSGVALPVAGLAATILLRGGWQATAIALAMLGALVFAVSFISLQVAGERRVPRRPVRVRGERRATPAPAPPSTAPRGPAGAPARRAVPIPWHA
jgi:hypothetical protein